MRNLIPILFTVVVLSSCNVSKEYSDARIIVGISTPDSTTPDSTCVTFWRCVIPNCPDGYESGTGIYTYECGGQILREMHKKDGLKNGMCRWYYESGALASEITFKDDQKEGIAKGYYESGALEYEIPFKDDQKEGIEKGYYESGALEYEMTFKDDQKEGIEKGYYESGALEYETTFKDDQKEGIEKRYYESGALEYEMTFKDDQKEGIAKGYYESGALKYETTFKDDQKEGIKKGYYESGSLAYERNYMDELTEIKLSISGQIKNQESGGRLTGCEVVVLQDGVTFDRLEVDFFGGYSCELPMRHIYTFDFGREGFVSKKVVLDGSNLPEGGDVEEFGFDLDITLFKMIKGFDESIMDTPIGIGVYDVETDKFNFDMDHTERVMQRIENEINRINLNND